MELPADPFPFDPEGPNGGNRGRVLFTELVRAAVDAGEDGDVPGLARTMDSGVGALSEDDLRAVVKFSVGFASAQQLGLL